jgi:hypothetical protein
MVGPLIQIMSIIIMLLFLAKVGLLILGKILGQNPHYRLPLDAGAAMTSPRTGTAPPAAVDVSRVVRNSRAFSEVQEVQAEPPPLSVASGVGPAFTARKGAIAGAARRWVRAINAGYKGYKAFTASKGVIAGAARGCQVRQESQDAGNTWQILAFRLDRFDDAGRPLPSVAVEMRGKYLKGHISDGEWIEVPGTWKDGELLEPKRVRNLTTGSWVEVGVSGSLLWVFQLLGFLVFLAFFFLLMFGPLIFK